MAQPFNETVYNFSRNTVLWYYLTIELLDIYQHKLNTCEVEANQDV